MKWKVSAFALLLVLAVVGTAAAQNLLVNPNFDSNVAGWSFTTPGTFTWDSSLDANSNPLSGSGRLDNTSPATFGTSFAAQCVAVTGGSNYDFWTQIRIPSGQTQTGYANGVVNFYDGASCGGSNVGGFASPSVLSTTTDTWVQSQLLTQLAPASAVSAQVNLWVNKAEANGSLVVNFDSVAFGPTGSLAPTPTPTPTANSTATPTATATSTPTATATSTPTATPTSTPTPTPTSTPAGVPTSTPTPTATPVGGVPTSTPTSTPVPTGAGTPIPATGRTGFLVLFALLAVAGFLILRAR